VISPEQATVQKPSGRPLVPTAPVAGDREAYPAYECRGRRLPERRGILASTGTFATDLGELRLRAVPGAGADMRIRSRGDGEVAAAVEVMRHR